MNELIPILSGLLIVIHFLILTGLAYILGDLHVNQERILSSIDDLWDEFTTYRNVTMTDEQLEEFRKKIED